MRLTILVENFIHDFGSKDFLIDTSDINTVLGIFE